MPTDEIPDLQVSDLDDMEDMDALSASAPSKDSQSNLVYGFFKNLTGNKVLEDSDLQPALKQMRESLIQKNVASHIADQVSDSVSSTLIGQKTGTFSSKSLFVSQS